MKQFIITMMVMCAAMIGIPTTIEIIEWRRRYARDYKGNDETRVQPDRG